MSKELIERLRADAESTDDIGLCADAADRIEELERRLECERMRLVACGVVAMADTPDSAKKVRQMHPDYESASCESVARRVDECISLREKCDALQADNTRLREALELTHDQAIKGRIFPTIASPTYWVNAVELALAKARKP